jgi:GxxExxY protein
MTSEGAESWTQVRDPQTYAIIGAAMEVHRVLGRGFLEVVYRQALRVELDERKIPFRSEVELIIRYKGIPLECRYKADFICHDEIILECKAKTELNAVDRAQILNYMKATGFHRALLINFGSHKLEYERIVLNY